MSTRFARVVIAQQQFHDDLCEEIPARKVVTLLQREHAAMVRKVKADAKLAVKVLKITRDTKEEMLAEGQRQYCAELLAWLHGRGR